MPKLCPKNLEIICEGALSKLLCVGRIDFSIKFGCIMTQPFLIEGIIEAATWREIPVPNQLLVLFLVVLRRGLSGRAVGILNVELGIQSGLYSIGIRCQFDEFTNYIKNARTKITELSPVFTVCSCPCYCALTHLLLCDTYYLSKTEFSWTI